MCDLKERLHRIFCFLRNFLSTACVHVWHENYSSTQCTHLLCDRSGKCRAQSWTCTSCGLQAQSQPGNTERLMDTNDQGSSRQIIYKPSRLQTVNLKQHMAAASYKSFCSGLGAPSVASGPSNCQLYSQSASKVDSSAKIGRGKGRPRGLCTAYSRQLHEEGVPNTFQQYFSHNHIDKSKDLKMHQCQIKPVFCVLVLLKEYQILHSPNTAYLKYFVIYHFTAQNRYQASQERCLSKDQKRTEDKVKAV